MRYFPLFFLWMSFATYSAGVGLFLMDSANNYDKNSAQSKVEHHQLNQFSVNHPVSFRDFMYRFRRNVPPKLSDTCPKSESFLPIVNVNDQSEKDRYIVKATPVDEKIEQVPHEDEKNGTQTIETGDSQEKSGAEISSEKEEEAPAKKQSNKTEDIPSFSEWTQKTLEEEQKKREEERRKREEEKEKKKMKHSSHNGLEVKENSTKITSPDHPSSSSNQIRLKKNFASLDCGAKVAASNAEAQSALNIITPSRDEYMLNKCNDKAWFVVELCESIKAFKVEIANFELYSSVPKDIRILMGNVIPGRDKDWSLFGQFEAKDDRNVQTFVSEEGVFGKYVKVEILSHYGHEHYCPISLFKIFGISEIELIGVDEDAVDDDLPHEDLSVDASTDPQTSDNTLIKMFKEGFRLFVGVFSPNEQVKDMDISQALNQSSLVGTTFMYNVFCPNCDANTFRNVYFLLAFNYATLRKSLHVNQVLSSALHTHVCHSYGFDMMMSSTSGSICLSSKVVEFYATLFGTSRIMALCNVIGIQKGTWSKADSHLIMPEWKNRLDNTSLIGDHQADIEKITHSVELPSEESSQASPPTAIREDESITSISSSLVQDENLVTESLTSTKEPFDENLSTLVTPSMSIDPTPSSSHRPTDPLPAKADETGDSTLKDPPEVVYVPPNPAVDAANNGQSQQQQSGRESVWQKLSNKIKALERNVSLSSGYLEELSVKYKKQIEDLQLAVRQSGEALVTITKARDQDEHEINELKEQIGQLKIVVEEVSSRMETMSTWAVVIHSLFLVAEVFIGLLLFLACFHRQGGADSRHHQKMEALSSLPVKRRHSFEGSVVHRDYEEHDISKRRRSLDVNAIRKNLLDGLSRRQKKKIQRRLSRANARSINNGIQVDNMFGLLSSHVHEDLLNGSESRSLTPEDRASTASTPSHHRPCKKNGTKIAFWSTTPSKASKKRSKSNSPPRKVESSVAKQKDMFRKFDPDNLDWIQRPKPVLTSVIPRQ